MFTKLRLGRNLELLRKKTQTMHNPYYCHKYQGVFMYTSTYDVCVPLHCPFLCPLIGLPHFEHLLFLVLWPGDVLAWRSTWSSASEGKRNILSQPATLHLIYWVGPKHFSQDNFKERTFWISATQSAKCSAFNISCRTLLSHPLSNRCVAVRDKGLDNQSSTKQKCKSFLMTKEFHFRAATGLICLVITTITFCTFFVQSNDFTLS